MHRLAAFLSLAVLTTSASDPPGNVDELKHTRLCAAWLTIKGKLISPPATPRFDTFYLEGFSDRMDNHQPLFSQLLAHGGRITTFDYSGHGESTGIGSPFYGLGSMMEMAAHFERRTRDGSSRPLIVLGWSTGGIAAVRMLQTGLFGRTPSGLILLAPGLFPRMVLNVREEDLTRDTPPRSGPARPGASWRHPAMAAGILWESFWARHTDIPLDVPILILAAGENTDRFVRTAPLREWARGQLDRGAEVYYYEFPDAYHELDNDLCFVSLDVHRMAGAFAQHVAEGDLIEHFGAPRIATIPFGRLDE